MDVVKTQDVPADRPRVHPAAQTVGRGSGRQRVDGVREGPPVGVVGPGARGGSGGCCVLSRSTVRGTARAVKTYSRRIRKRAVPARAEAPRYTVCCVSRPADGWTVCRTAIAAQVTRYAAVAEPADWRCSRRPGRRPAPKVKRAWSSVHRRVEATVITAFARANGITVASSGTAAPDSSPIPPPQTTNRTNDESAPGLD